MTIFLFEIRCNQQPPWRNRLARSAVNRKVGGSSPPGGGFSFVIVVDLSNKDHDN